MASDLADQRQLTGYQTLAQFFSAENTIFWARHSSFLLSNSVLAAVAAFALRGTTPEPALFVRALAMGGTFLALIWLLATRKGIAIVKLYLAQLLELERVLEPISVFTYYHKAFHKKEPIEFKLTGERFHAGCISSWPIMTMSQVLPLVFLALWLSLLFGIGFFANVFGVTAQ